MAKPKKIQRSQYIDLEEFFGVEESPYETTLGEFAEYMKTWVGRYGADTKLVVGTGYDHSELVLMYSDTETEDEATERHKDYLARKRARITYLRKKRTSEIKRLKELKEKYPNEGI